jgi:hypothetical protein
MVCYVGLSKNLRKCGRIKLHLRRKIGSVCMAALRNYPENRLNFPVQFSTGLGLPVVSVPISLWLEAYLSAQDEPPTRKEAIALP